MNIIFELEQHLRGQGRADRTVKEYVKWGRRLARWCITHGEDLASLPPHRLRDWIDAKVPPGRESRKQAYTACHHLYEMLGRTDRPWEAIRVPRKRQGDPNPLPDPHVRKLRDTALMHGRREGLATLGLIYTAARPSEVAVWRWDGIDWEQATIRFWRTKTRDWHTVQLHPVLRLALERFCPAEAEGYVFIGASRPHVSPTTIWTWVRKVAAVADVDGVTPRRLRATAGCKVANTTRDIQAAARLLGHTSLDTTNRYYTTVNDERMAAAVGSLAW